MIDLTNTPLPEHIRQYVKKPIPIRAMKIDEPFVVDTLEGRHTGDAGDYLVVGIRGERYPVKRDIFEESYTEFLQICIRSSPIKVKRDIFEESYTEVST